jgi:hypothetical protein
MQQASIRRARLAAEIRASTGANTPAPLLFPWASFYIPA